MMIALFVILCLIVYLVIGFFVNVFYIRVKGENFGSMEHYFEIEKNDHIGFFLLLMTVWPVVVLVSIVRLAYHGVSSLLKGSLRYFLKEKG